MSEELKKQIKQKAFQMYDCHPHIQHREPTEALVTLHDVLALLNDYVTISKELWENRPKMLSLGCADCPLVKWFGKAEKEQLEK